MKFTVNTIIVKLLETFTIVSLEIIQLRCNTLIITATTPIAATHTTTRNTTSGYVAPTDT